MSKDIEINFNKSIPAPKYSEGQMVNYYRVVDVDHLRLELKSSAYSYEWQYAVENIHDSSVSIVGEYRLNGMNSEDKGNE